VTHNQFVVPIFRLKTRKLGYRIPAFFYACLQTIVSIIQPQELKMFIDMASNPNEKY
tara:strand:- start:1 stop:171 length:171 start_codon:yes stop_codon:yes gene_type:complete